MPGNLARMVVTTVIWIVCALVVVMSSIFGNVSEIAVVAPLIAATIGTLVVWTAGETSTSRQPLAARDDHEKAKRGAQGDARIHMLLELMTPEEREAFKETLKAQVMGDLRRGMPFDDGEMPSSVASLLDDDDQPYRREERSARR